MEANMVYSNDLWVLLPTRDLYDSQMMAIAINAAKDMYEKGQQEIKDFNKLYGDFYSPVPGRTLEVYNETLGKVKNVVNAIYSAGGDPLRSPEARALISRAINEVDAGKINAYKLGAEIAKEYIKNRNRARMEGWYDEGLERFINNGKTLEEWSAGDGLWTNGAPTKFQTMDDIISPLAKAMTPEFDPVRTASENNGYDYKTVSQDRIQKMVNDNLNDLITKSLIGRYYYDRALKASGENPDLAKLMLAKQYAQIAGKYTEESREINLYNYAKVQDELRRNAAKEQAALLFYYKQKEDDMAFDLDSDGKLSKDELLYKKEYKNAQIRKMLGDKSDDSINIFREADKKPGEMIGFTPSSTYKNKIDPDDDKIVLNGDGSYTIPSKDVKTVFETGSILSLDGGILKYDKHSEKGQLYARPQSGIIRMPLRYKDPKTGKISIYKDRDAYYIRALLIYKNGTVLVGNKTVDKYDPITTSSNGYVLMRVRERDKDYGKK